MSWGVLDELTEVEDAAELTKGPMRPDRPCWGYDDLSDRERREVWGFSALVVAVLFAATALSQMLWPV